MNVETQDKQNLNSELVERIDIENTPFTIIGIDGMFFGVMGKYRITDEAKTKKEIEKELQSMTWNRVVQVILLLLETQKEIKI